MTCQASEEPASKGALWLFHLIVSAGGAWLFSTGSDEAVTMPAPRDHRFLWPGSSGTHLPFSPPLSCRGDVMFVNGELKGAGVVAHRRALAAPTWMLLVDVCLSRGLARAAPRAAAVRGGR